MGSKHVRSVVVEPDLWDPAVIAARARGVSVAVLVREGLRLVLGSPPVVTAAPVETPEPALEPPRDVPPPPREDAAPPPVVRPPEPLRVPVPPPVDPGFPDGFSINPWGAATWVTGQVRYQFPAAKRAHWTAAVRMIEELGSPVRYPSAWEGVSNDILSWLAPRPV